jgi:hypothetical protein
VQLARLSAACPGLTRLPGHAPEPAGRLLQTWRLAEPNPLDRAVRLALR